MKLIKFSATWCSHCAKLSQLLDTKFSSNPLVQDMSSYDIDKNRDMATKFNVKSVPTLVIVDDSNEVIRTKTGMLTAEQASTFLNN